MKNSIQDSILESGFSITHISKKTGVSRKTIYNIMADQRVNQFDDGNKLSKVDMKILPPYILENKDKFIDWIEE